MATLKQRLHRKNSSGSYDVVHLETSASCVLMSDGTTAEAAINGKAASSHNHAASAITSGTLSSSRLPTVPMSKGGLGTSVDIVNAPNNAILRRLKTDEYDQVYYTATKNGALYATSENGSLTFGTLPVAQGGTGVTSSTANYVFAAPNGSAGAPTFRKLVAADIPSLAASKITSGTLDSARLPTVPITKGGMGQDISGYPPYAIMRMTSDPTSTSYDYVYYIATNSGALYATKENGKPVFGTLPVAQGGTGATTAKGAEYAINGGIGELTAAINDDYSVVFKYAEPSATQGVFGYRKASLFWDYIKGKADSVYAASSHNHAASNITSGTLAVARLPTVTVAKGGTGKTSLTSGSYLVGAGTSAVTLKTPAQVLSDIGAAANSNFVKSGSTAAAGLVPAPPTTAGTTKYLREDGTWQVPPDNNTTYTLSSITGTLAASKGGTGQTTLYPAVGTAGVRAIYAGTSDMTAGSSSLSTGALYFVYE